MKQAEFTDKIGEEILSKFDPKKATKNCCACVLDNRYGEKGWRLSGEVCYAPPASHLNHGNNSKHPDHFGVYFYGQGAGGTHTAVEPAKDPYNDEMYDYLETAMDPKGPFAKVLPNLWHSTAKEVWKDKGFIVYDALDDRCNPGLLWTFLQAVRMPWEHSFMLPAYTEAKKATKDKIVALYTVLALKQKDKNKWTNARGWLHGDALGSGFGNPLRLRKTFLRGVVEQKHGHSPGNSWQCFRGEEAYDNVSAKETIKPIDEWVKEFEGIRASA